MTTTARQPEPRFVDPDGRASTVEVLIPEARARARRRRTIYTVLALVLLGGFALAVNVRRRGREEDRRTGGPSRRRRCRGGDRFELSAARSAPAGSGAADRGRRTRSPDRRVIRG